MIRLSATRGCHVLWKSSHFVTSCVTKKQVNGFLRVNGASHHRAPFPARHFSTVNPVCKDAVPVKEEKETDTLDLDRWKSVMRSQAASEEKQVNDEVEASDDGEKSKEQGDELKDGSSLEATRDLVVMWRQAGKLVPQEMTDEEVQRLAALTTKSARKKYLKYLATKEGLKLAHKKKQQQKAAEREASLKKRESESSAEEGDDQRHIMKNSLIMQFWGRSLDKVLAWRSAQAMQFGQPLVFDMSYESSMSRREVENTVSQLMEVEGWNRRSTDPFHLHFCNLQPDGAYKQQLLKRYGDEAWERLLITSTDQQHVDIFPREQLLYLTADSPNVLRTFDHSKVYIIGALVDRSIQTGLSMANAKRLKLATARLPLDEFLNWELGAKNLTLDQVIRIMLTIKDTGRWEEALKFVPLRKHDGFHQQQTKTAIIKNKARSVTNHGWKEFDDRPLRSRERNGGRTFKSGSLFKSGKESSFTGKDRMAGLGSDRENTPAATKVRTSFKSNIEARKSVGREKTWWHDE